MYLEIITQRGTRWAIEALREYVVSACLLPLAEKEDFHCELVTAALTTGLIFCAYFLSLLALFVFRNNNFLF